MAEALILEFAGLSEEHYAAVNERLGLDIETGAGDWPAGLLFHVGGVADNGLTVVEVWESREAQGTFMEGRLGRALQEAGVTSPPSRVAWSSVVGLQNLAS